jgi:hypothetical protein
MVMLILYLIIIKLTELAGFDPYENLVISIIGCILIAPVLHKLAEIFIVEFLAKYTIGSAVAGLLTYLDILHNIEALWGAHTPLEEMNSIMYVAMGVILSIIIGFIVDKLYEYFKSRFAKSHARAADYIAIAILLLLSLYTEHDQESIEPEIIALTTDVPNMAVNKTIVLTAEVSNPSNVNILYRFYLNNNPLTEWIRQNQCIWTITDSDLGESKIEVRIMDERMKGEDKICDSKHIDAIIQRFS